MEIKKEKTVTVKSWTVMLTHIREDSENGEHPVQGNNKASPPTF